jgi:hypothetical protein
MSQVEFLSWAEFYRNEPFDDYHRFIRPAALISARGGGDVSALLDWLRPPPDDGRSSADRDLFAAAGATPPPMRPA